MGRSGALTITAGSTQDVMPELGELRSSGFSEEVPGTVEDVRRWIFVAWVDPMASVEGLLWRLAGRCGLLVMVVKLFRIDSKLTLLLHEDRSANRSVWSKSSETWRDDAARRVEIDGCLYSHRFVTDQAQSRRLVETCFKSSPNPSESSKMELHSTCAATLKTGCTAGGEP